MHSAASAAEPHIAAILLYTASCRYSCRAEVSRTHEKLRLAPLGAQIRAKHRHVKDTDTCNTQAGEAQRLLAVSIALAEAT